MSESSSTPCVCMHCITGAAAGYCTACYAPICDSCRNWRCYRLDAGLSAGVMEHAEVLFGTGTLSPAPISARETVTRREIPDYLL